MRGGQDEKGDCLMAWEPWIEIEPDDTADEVVARLYDRTRDRATGRPSDTVRLNSLTPQVAGLLYDLQKAIYHGANGSDAARERDRRTARLDLERLRALNRKPPGGPRSSGPGSESGAAGQGGFHQGRPEPARTAHRRLHRQGDACAQCVLPAELEELRQAGLGDKDILSLVQIIAYYNLSTRLFESLSTVEP